jgi:hypothetical protein
MTKYTKGRVNAKNMFVKIKNLRYLVITLDSYKLIVLQR